MRPHYYRHRRLDAAPLLNHRRDRNSVASQHRRDPSQHARLILRHEAQIILAYHVVYRLDTGALDPRDRIAERMSAAARTGQAMPRNLDHVRHHGRRRWHLTCAASEIHARTERLAMNINRVE